MHILVKSEDALVMANDSNSSIIAQRKSAGLRPDAVAQLAPVFIQFLDSYQPGNEDCRQDWFYLWLTFICFYFYFLKNSSIVSLWHIICVHGVFRTK